MRLRNRLASLLYKPEKRATYDSGTTLDDDFVVKYFGVNPNGNGVTVNQKTAMQHGVYVACIRIIAETIGSLTRNVYERMEGGGRQKAIDIPQQRLLHSEPNTMMTDVVFYETLAYHAAHHGNGYAYIEKNSNQLPQNMWILDPDDVRVVSRGHELYYITHVHGEPVTMGADQVLHIPSVLSQNGIVGVSPVDWMKHSLGMSMAAEQYGERFFSHGTHLGHILEMEGNPPKERREYIRQSIEEFHQGLQNSHKVALLPNKIKHKSVGIDAEKAQLLELRQFQVQDIARVFRIPLHLLNDLARSTFSNIQEQELDFLIHCLRPWLVRFEKECNRKLFTERQKARYYTKFEVDSLLRGDTLTRTTALKEQFLNGTLTINEWRELEDRNPIGPEGDKHYIALNMQAVEDSPQPQPQPEPEPEPEQDNSREILLADAARRLRTKEINAIKRAIRKHMPDVNAFAAWAEQFYNGHEMLAARTYDPIVRAYGGSHDDLAKIIQEHIWQSTGDIADALAAEDPAAALRMMIDRWTNADSDSH